MTHYAHFKTTDLQQVFNVVADYPFALITKNNIETGLPDIVNAPVLVSDDRGSLEFHFARANPAWKNFEAGGEVKLIFSGPNAHVSPSWYKDRFANGDRSKTAPTWDYVQAAISGKLEALDDDGLKKHLEKLTGHFEGATADGWAYSEIKDDTRQNWQKLIGGFTLRITHAEAIFKLSQEQAEADRAHVVAGLKQRGGDNDIAVAKLIARGLKK